MIEKIKDALSTFIKADSRDVVRTHRQVFGQAPVFQRFGIQEEFPEPMRTAKNQFRGVFFRGITMRSNLISKGMMEFTVSRMIGQNETEEVETAHPWVQFMANPARDILPPKTFYKWVSESYDLTGKADMIVERGAMNMPIRLLPVFDRFGSVTPAPSSDGGVAGWVFLRSDGKKEIFPPEDVIRIGRTSPFSPWETISLLGAALLDLDAETFIKEFRRDSVKSGGITSTILTTDNRVTKDQSDRYSQDLRKFMGRRGQNKVLVLGDGMKPMSQTSKELEAVSGLSQTKEDIREILGIPSGLFQANANRASAESLRAQFAEDTINPELEDIAAHLEFGMRRSFGSDESLVIEVPDLSPMNTEQEIRWRTHLLSTGQRVINDFRGEDGKEEIQNGDVHFIPPNFIPIDQALFTPVAEAPETDEERAYTEERLTWLWRTIDRQKGFERAIARNSTKEAFKRIEKLILNTLEEQTRAVSVEGLIDESRIEAILDEELTAIALRILRRGFETSAERFDLNVRFSAVDIRRELDGLLRRTKTVRGTLKSKLGDTVENAIREGKTTSEVRTLIQKFFSDGAALASIDRVAQTMTNGGFESGQLGSFKKAGIKQKRWLSQRDGKVRETHDDADGQVVGVNEFFLVGGDELRHPADPNGTAEEVINCRCSQLPVR